MNLEVKQFMFMLLKICSFGDLRMRLSTSPPDPGDSFFEENWYISKKESLPIFLYLLIVSKLWLGLRQFSEFYMIVSVLPRIPTQLWHFFFYWEQKCNFFVLYI